MGQDLASYLTSVSVTEGEFAGWLSWGPGSFEYNAGPFYFRKHDDGGVVTAFRAAEKHVNRSGHVHGGCLMTFADMAAFNVVRLTLDPGRTVTLQMHTEFVGPAVAGDLIESRAEILKAGGRTIFVRGTATANAMPCLNWSAMLYRRKMIPPV